MLDAWQQAVADAPATGALIRLVEVSDVEEAVALARAFAPEHLQLAGPRVEALAGEVTRRAAFFSARTRERRSATTSPAQITCCRRAGRPDSSRRCHRRTSAAASPWCGSSATRPTWRVKRPARARGGIRASRTLDGSAHSGQSDDDAPRLPIERKTDETDVRVDLTLDGDGAGTRETGVGFFDHMLDLLARHGRLDLTVEARGDLHTGAHHTVEDVGICIGQALDEALAGRTGITRYGQATVPMDEARASCAIDISGRGFCAWEGSIPPGTIGNFDHELTEEFFRALATNAKLTLHLTVDAGHQRAPHDRSGVQGGGASAARGGGARSDRTRRAEHQGDAGVIRIAVVDYGMGNRRSVQKAFEHVGRARRDHRRPRRDPGRRRGRRPGVGAFPARCATSAPSASPS